MNVVNIIVARNSKGGASRIARQLANILSESGYKVNFFILRKSFEEHKKYWPTLKSAINTFSLNGLRSSLSLPKLLFNLSKTKGHIICFGRASAIVTFFTNLISNTSKNHKFLIWEGKSLEDAEKGSTTFLGRKLFPMIIRKIYPKADYLIGISNEECINFKKYLNLNNNRKVKKIYTPAISDTHIEKLNEAPERWYYDFKKNSKIIISAGSLLKQKNFCNLIDAFKKIRELKGNLKLLIMGEGPERKALERQIDSYGLKENILLPGFIDNPLPYIKESECFVLSSDWEGLPGILIEALLCDIRIVATNCPSGPEEILNNGRFGRLVQPSDSKKLANAIIESLSQDKATGLYSRAMDFQDKKIVKEYIKILEQ